MRKTLPYVTLFPFSEYWWFYVGFTALVLLLLLLDLGVFHRKAHVISIREAGAWTVLWIALALVFNFGLYHYALEKFHTDPRLLAIPGFEPAAAARQVGLEFLTGYVIEKALSVDNIFVFVVVFNYFAIPAQFQHRVLFYGILGALIFRGIFIALGALLFQYFWVVVAFGILLIITGAKMFFASDEGIHPERNPILKFLRRHLPVTSQFHGGHFLVKLNGRTHGTPLLVALVFLECTDIIFAIDSVPAIFAVTHEPLLVFTSNIFAILGLRALYFVLAGAVRQFHMLRYALAVVLIFVGLKMAWLNHAFGGKFPIEISLGIIAALVAGGILLSLIFPKREAPRTEAPGE